MPETPGHERVSPLVFNQDINKSAENRAQVAVGCMESALATLTHATAGHLSSTMVANAHTSGRRTRTRVHRASERCPTHAGSEQTRHTQNGQNSDNDAHVFTWKPEERIITGFWQREVNHIRGHAVLSRAHFVSRRFKVPAESVGQVEAATSRRVPWRQGCLSGRRGRLPRRQGLSTAFGRVKSQRWRVMTLHSTSAFRATT